MSLLLKAAINAIKESAFSKKGRNGFGSLILNKFVLPKETTGKN